MELRAIIILVGLVGAGWLVLHHFGTAITGWLQHLHSRKTYSAAAAPSSPPPSAVAYSDPKTILRAVTAEVAYKRYKDAGGLAGAKGNLFFQGYLDLYEINWLKSLSPQVRHQWAVDFADQEPIDPESYNNVGDIKCTQSVCSYLLTHQANYGLIWEVV